MAQIETVDIDTDGDVLLAFHNGSGDSPSAHLRVSSAILIQASPVFKKLLFSRYKEGTEFAKSASVKVPLPDDDLDLMTTLCNIIHLRHNDVPCVVDEDSLLAFALLCDKYHCAIAVKPSIECWILQNLASKTKDCDKTTMAAYAKLLCAAEQLGNGTMIKRIGSKIVLHATLPISWLKSAAPNLEDSLINSLTMLQRQFRDDLKTIVTDALHYELTEQRDSCDLPTCTVGHHRLWYLFEELERMDLWPLTKIPSNSLGSLLDTLATCNFRKMAPPPSGQPGPHGYRCNSEDGLAWDHECERLRKSAVKLRNKIEALTLEGKSLGE